MAEPVRVESGAFGEVALGIGDFIVCPGCELEIAKVLSPLRYGEPLDPAALQWAGKKYALGDPTLCSGCGADWQQRLTVVRG